MTSCSAIATTTPRLAGLPLAAARPLQLGARLLRRLRRAATTRPALWIVDDDGSEDKAHLRARSPTRSNRSPTTCAPRRPARRPHAADARPTCVPLWEIDARGDQARRRHHPGDDAARRTDDLRDRLERGDVAPRRSPTRGRRRKFAALHGRATRASPSARRAAGWLRFDDARRSAGATFAPDGPTRADDPLLLYFTSGTTAQAQAGAAHAPELSGRPPVDDVLDRPAARATSTNISSPGWAKHAWSCFFAPWNAGATVFIYNYARFNAQAAAGCARALPRHHAVRAADGLAHADPGGSRGVSGRAARAGQRRRAAQPGSHRAGAAAPGA